MINYKGLFYNEDRDKKYYEGGAHFKYSDLVNALLELQKDAKINQETITLKKEKNNCVNIFKIDNSIKNIKEIDINSNLLTINSNKNSIYNRSPLRTDKNLDKEKLKKKRIIELYNQNVKMYSLINNNNRKYYCNNSKNKNNKIDSLKNIVNDNNNNSNRTNYFLKSQVNNIKKDDELPLIQSSYFNKIYNYKNDFDQNNNITNKFNLKLSSLKKTRIFKDKLLLKNKVLSPNRDAKSGNKFLKEILETYKNSKNFDTIEIYSKKNKYNFEKLVKYLNDNKKNQKTINNINLAH